MSREAQLISEIPIRIRLELSRRDGFTKATDLVNDYLRRRAARFQLPLNPQIAGGITAFDAESIGLRISAKSSEKGLYFSTSEHLMPSTLTGRREVSVLLTNDGRLDIQMEVSRKGDAGYPLIAVPEFLESLSLDGDIGLLEAATQYAVRSVPVAINGQDSLLKNRLLNVDGTMATIVVGLDTQISSIQLTNLAKRTCGIAHVFTIENREQARLLALELGDSWLIPDGTIRVYGPGLAFENDPLRHSRVFTATIDEESSPSVPTFGPSLNEIVWSAGRFSAAALANRPMPSVEVAERILAIAAPFSATIDTLTAPEIDQRRDDLAVEVLEQRIEQLQLIIDELRSTIAVLAEEKDFEAQVALSWKSTAEQQRRQLELFDSASASSELLAKVSKSWRAVMEALLLEAVQASEQESLIANLRDTLAVLTSQYRVLEGRGSRNGPEVSVSAPVPGDPESLAIYLTERYAGRFALLGQGARSFKSTTPYVDWDRFLAALDILGVEYYKWKTASKEAVLAAKEAFEERCRQMSLKSSPSATLQGQNAYPDDHVVRLMDGSRLPMYELRDHGTTMEERFMLYIGFVWDENTGQIVLGRFNHPPVLSMHT